MSRSDKAGEYFHGSFGDNCAQAVLRAYSDRFAISDETIGAHSRDGGGRAEGGVCGALVAATLLVPEKVDIITEKFTEMAGSPLCRDIRKGKKLTCRQCVEAASSLVDSV